MNSRFFNPLWTMGIVGAVAAVGLLAFFFSFRPSSVTRSGGGEQSGEIFVYCAAGMRYAMELVAEDYEEEFGIRINLQYGGSNTLLSQIKTADTGDLYLAADTSYIEIAREAGLVEEQLQLAKLSPVITVKKSNDKIRGVSDLANPENRVALGVPDAAAVGKKTKKLLTKTGHWEAVEKNVTENGVFKQTVNEVANAVKLDAVAAGVVWDSTVFQYPDLKAVRTPELDAGESMISLGVLTSSRQPRRALHFARFVAARDRGLVRFEEKGFRIIDGDKWQDTPTLTFYSGAVNRRAIENAVQEFSEREGVEVNTVFNGCGILTADMRSIRKGQTGAFPDAYMACDVYYLDSVQEMFQPGKRISSTDIVIVVAKDNPLKIKSLADLQRDGVRVALGQPNQCTIGVLSRKLLQANLDYDALLKNNVVTQTATSALLVPTITTGSADATLAYITDTLSESERLQVIRIDSPLARAVQPFSVSLSSDHKHLAQRLFERIGRAQGDFEDAGFNWELGLDLTQSGTSETQADPDRSNQ